MIDQLSELKLEDRPKLKLATWFKWLAIIAFALAVLLIILGLLLGYFYIEFSVGDETRSGSILGAVVQVLESLGYYMISLGFYGLMLWLAAKAVDYLDQLVWLNATDEDRRKIISQRTK